MADISLQQLTGFTHQLATLLGAGIPLLQALETMAMSASNKPLQNLANSLRLSVSNGHSLQHALTQTQVFDAFFCQLVAAGELTGTLDQVLQRLGSHLEKQHALRQQIKSAMVYPAAVMSIAVLVITVIMVWVVPVFAGIFSSFQTELPAATLWVLHLSQAMVTHGPAVVLCSVLFAWSVRHIYQRQLQWQLKLAIAVLRMPVVGLFIQASTLAAWTRCLSTLVNASVPLLDALEVTAGICQNRAFSLTTLAVRHSVSQGRSLAQAMQSVYPLYPGSGVQKSLFPLMLVHMVAIGEESGALAHLLARAAQELEQQIEQQIQSMLQLLEPLMLVVLGTVVGGLVVALYLPVFQLGQLM